MNNRLKIHTVFWLALAAVWLAGCDLPMSGPTPTLTPSAPPSKRLIGYFYGLDRSQHIADIPADKFAILIDAFIDVSSDGKCVSIDPSGDAEVFPELGQLKQRYPGLKTVVSVGGYAHSAKFSDAAASDASRRAFAQSCVAFMTQNGFDGIDIDWETPVSGGLAGNTHRPEDKQNYTALLAALRNQLDALGRADKKSYLLGAALPAGPGDMAKFELGKVHPYLDWMTVMAYAFYTGESKITNFNAPLYPTSTDPAKDEKRRLLYNGDAAVQAYLTAGVPGSKISLGVPFYGRAWKGVPADNNGLYQNDTGVFVDSGAPKGTWSSGGEITYRALEQNYLGAWPRFWQSEAQVPWLYNPELQVMLTYDDPESLAAKADYVTSKHLGGISIWQVSMDDAQHTLVNALYVHLNP